MRLAVIAILFTTPLLADDQSDFERYQLTALEQESAKLVWVEKTRRIQDRKKRTRKEVDEWLENEQKSPIPVPYLDVFDMQVGDVGKISYSKDYNWYLDHTLASSLNVLQILGPDKMLVQPVYRKEFHDPFMLVGYTTKNLVTNSRIAPGDVMDVTGTETYDTASGATRTVFVVRPFEFTEEINKKIVAENAARAEKFATENNSSVTLDDEHTAAARLKLAQRLLSRNRETGLKWLKKLIAEFPNTTAAGKAREIAK